MVACRWLDNLRREVDEKVQQLAMLSNLSALLAGFAIIALVRMPQAARSTHLRAYRS